jgi:hypothetical protein
MLDVSSCDPSPTAPYPVLTLSHDLNGPAHTSRVAADPPLTVTVALAVADALPLVQVTE